MCSIMNVNSLVMYLTIYLGLIAGYRHGQGKENGGGGRRDRNRPYQRFNKQAYPGTRLGATRRRIETSIVLYSLI